MFLWMALIGGCGQAVEISYYAESCTDWEFDEGDLGSEVELASNERGFLFMRPGVEQYCSASFQPEIEVHRRLIQVFEFWDVISDSEECTSCFTPIVALRDLPRGTYDLQWYEGRVSTLPIGVRSLTVPSESEE